MRKTGRLVVADGGWRTCGFAAEVAAEVAGEVFQYLRAPIVRVTLPDTPAPMSKALEREYHAGSDRIKVRGRESGRHAGRSRLSRMAAVDYTDVTEAVGHRITREALDMMWTRYAFAARYCDRGDVLEVACGAGQGLGTLSARARRVVGGDYTGRLLEMARHQYQGRVALVQLDAQALPFRDGSFDVVVLYEALYYLQDARGFIDEARRVLRAGGHVVAVPVNREWVDFNPSPLSTMYFSHSELREMLRAGRFSPSLFGAFPVTHEGGRDRFVSGVKRTAVRLGLMPKTMRGKRLLKRLFLGQLVDFPAEMREGLAAYREPVALAPRQPANGFKVIYAVGTASEP